MLPSYNAEHYFLRATKDIFFKTVITSYLNRLTLWYDDNNIEQFVLNMELHMI